MQASNYIVVDPEICHGKACFKNTRIMVATVLELLEAGQSVQQILEAYPVLTAQHVQAALHLAAELLEGEEVHTLHAPA